MRDSPLPPKSSHIMKLKIISRKRNMLFFLKAREPLSLTIQSSTTSLIIEKSPRLRGILKQICMSQSCVPLKDLMPLSSLTILNSLEKTLLGNNNQLKRLQRCKSSQGNLNRNLKTPSDFRPLRQSKWCGNLLLFSLSNLGLEFMCAFQQTKEVHLIEDAMIFSCCGTSCCFACT